LVDLLQSPPPPILSALYILFGNFRALLTFNGLGEYSFFFLTTLGALVLRWKEPELKRPYKPWVIIPGTFVVVSGFVVVRGAIFAPVQAGVLLGVWALGVGFWFARKRNEVLSCRSSCQHQANPALQASES
jgi:L-type amino acid transporter 9